MEIIFYGYLSKMELIFYGYLLIAFLYGIREAIIFVKIHKQYAGIGGTLLQGILGGLMWPWLIFQIRG